MPKISLIIPVCNVALYVKRCMTSVLAQSLTDYEVIIVDDGSTDDSIDIIRSVIGKDRRFRIIHQDNAGSGRVGSRSGQKHRY